MRNIRLLICAAAVSVMTAGSVTAQDQGIGAGIIIGEPTGLSIKGWMSERTALAGAVAWAFDPNTSLHIHGDYLIHNYDLLNVDAGTLPVYYGLGARIKFDDKEHPRRDRDRRTRAGVRIPAGLNYHFEDIPADIFIEIAPIFDIAPKTDFSLNAAIGARLFFK